MKQSSTVAAVTLRSKAQIHYTDIWFTTFVCVCAYSTNQVK